MFQKAFKNVDCCRDEDDFLVGKKSIDWMREYQTSLEGQERRSSKQVFCKRRKKPLPFETGSCCAMNGASDHLKCIKKQLGAATTTILRQSYTTSTLFERPAATLTTALRQITLSLLPLQAAANGTTNTNLVTSTGSGSNSHLSSVLPLSLGHFLRLTLTFCQWTIAFTTLLLFIVCLTNLIASVSAQQHYARSYGAKTIPAAQRFIELNHHHHQFSSPAARLRSSAALGSKAEQSNHLHGIMSSASSGIKTVSRLHRQPSLLEIVNDDSNYDQDLVHNLNRRHLSIATTGRKKHERQHRSGQSSYARSVVPVDELAIETPTTAISGEQTASLPALNARQSSTTMVPADSQWIPIFSAALASIDHNKLVISPYFSHHHNQHQTAELALLDNPSSLHLQPFPQAVPKHVAELASSPNRQRISQNQQPKSTHLRTPTTPTTSTTTARPSHSSASTAQEPMQSIGSHHHHRYGLHYHYPSDHWNQHYKHRQHHPHHNNPYQHRRPRLNSPALLDNEISLMEPAKIYTRVLLCDKTLVSLDYVRNLDSEPRPFAHPVTYKASTPSSPSLPPSSDNLIDEVLNDIGDNLIDLEGHYSGESNSYLEVSNSSLAANDLGRPIETGTTGRFRHNQQIVNHMHTPSGGNEFQSSNVSASTSNSNSSSALLAPLERLSSSASMLERRSGGSSSSQLLNDEDPLVRCDMWDLEKGLKSRKPPEHLLRAAIKADFDTVRDAINRCRQLSEKTLPPEDEYRDGLEIMSTEDLVSLFSMKRGLIPGTKWCGLGDQANTYNDLGPKHRIDICCRAHDHCPIRSKPFRNDYGVLNIGLYTKSHCDCDADFYRCLREVRSRTADMLGNLYFNVMKLQCMREERLKVCREMKPIALGFERCIRYEDSPVKTVFKFTTPPVAY